MTLWAAILASIGWKWIAPYSLLVDGTRYDLRDMTAEEQKTLHYLLRQALRNRKLRDVRADNRRGRLRKRAEAEGVDHRLGPYSQVGLSSTTAGGGSVVYNCFWWRAHS